jgi:hypothetical protein
MKLGVDQIDAATLIRLFAELHAVSQVAATVQQSPPT